MIMTNKDIEEYHNIGLDTATKVFNRFKDGTLPWLELDLDFGAYTNHTEFAKIEGSTIELDIWTMPKAPKKIVTVWAKVKADTCQISAPQRIESKNKLTINKIWSKPLGKICKKPIVI